MGRLQILRQEIGRLSDANKETTGEVTSLKSKLEDRDAQMQKMKQDFALLGQQLAIKRTSSTGAATADDAQPLSIEMAELGRG